jgi:hypothetical protein
MLYRLIVGGQVVNGPITYLVDNKQYVTFISGNTMVTLGLRE